MWAGRIGGVLKFPEVSIFGWVFMVFSGIIIAVCKRKERSFFIFSAVQDRPLLHRLGVVCFVRLSRVLLPSKITFNCYAVIIAEQTRSFK